MKPILLCAFLALMSPLGVSASTAPEELNAEAPYLALIKPSERIFINKQTKKVHFLAKQGSLQANIEHLLAATTTKETIFFVSAQHQNLTDIWIIEDSISGVINTLLQSYNEPYPIKGTPHANGVVTIFYDYKNRR